MYDLLSYLLITIITKEVLYINTLFCTFLFCSLVVPKIELYVPSDVLSSLLDKPKYYTQIVNVSAYTASEEECGKSNGITASGIPAVEGVTVAADHLPFGTKVIINGNEYIVQDRFGGGYRDRVDVYMTNRGDAIRWGRKEIEVKIMEE